MRDNQFDNVQGLIFRSVAMKSYLPIVLVGICLWIGQASRVYSKSDQSPQEHTIQINHNLDTDVITARLVRFRIAKNIDRYHAVDLSAQYIYSGKAKQAQPKVDLEVLTIVKARKLNTDLYVVFVVDGKEVHFGSNRSAIRNPVPGRLWIGERLVFSVPVEEFQKLATAEKLAIKMGGVRFDLDEDACTALKFFAEKIRQIGQ